MPDIIAADIGLQYEAIAFNPARRILAKVLRSLDRSDGVSNILIRFDAATGQAFSATGNAAGRSRTTAGSQSDSGPGAPASRATTERWLRHLRARGAGYGSQ